ncbi:MULTISPECIES: hypothetical protein [Alteribacter]|uniref:hypothetical protein n=1 Tax=Alteribacter TaxID=2823237 RepID=UPI00115CDE4E|nr:MULTISPECIES: hypothetical protein [Alteribacter]MBM7097995.1 hypothetical protein [Alteribacter salitolerans]
MANSRYVWKIHDKRRRINDISLPDPPNKELTNFYGELFTIYGELRALYADFSAIYKELPVIYADFRHF